MRYRIEDFHREIAVWCGQRRSVAEMADALARIGFLVSHKALRVYCRKVGLRIEGDEGGGTAGSEQPEDTVEQTTTAVVRKLELPQPQFPTVSRSHRWPLNRPLLYFEEVPWRIREAVEGTLVVGSTGSGKSSGAGHVLSDALLDAEFGGLILAAKSDEKEMWVRRVAFHGRELHLCIFEPGGPFRFNFMDYLLHHPELGVRSVQNVVRCFETVLEVFSRNQSAGENSSFWIGNQRRLLGAIVRILAHASGTLKISEIQTFLRETPKTPKDVFTGTWKQTSVFWPRLRDALAQTKGTPEQESVERARDYFLFTYPNEPEITRGGVEMGITALTETFFDPVMEELFCSDTNIIPEHCMQGAIVLVNLPLKNYPTQGLLAASIWKHLFQQAVERRSDPNDDSRLPVFEWIDEAQLFFSPNDALFQSTARSSRCATVVMTQNLPNFYASVGGPNVQHVVDGYFSNLNSKVFLWNNCPVTNEWCAEQLGKSRRFRVSGSDASGSILSAFLSPNSTASGNFNVGSELEYNVAPHLLTQLRGGGPENHYEVDAYVVLGANAYQQIGRHYLSVIFHQQHEDEVVEGEVRLSGWMVFFERLKAFCRWPF